MKLITYNLFTNLFRAKKKQLFLIVCISLGIIISCPSVIKAKDVNVPVSAVVDQYLAVYKSRDGNVRAETNITNKYFADENICVIDY